METVGIICEYNPFHNGHAAQIRQIRSRFGSDCAVVCLMSGNYVQRGEPAIYSKNVRAKAAVLCGSDLVLELPLTVALRSAEGFASGGVELLSSLGCGALSFGSECGDVEKLINTARCNLDPRFDDMLRDRLSSGCSYPTARELALRDLGGGEGVSTPNDILGVEYCKAILRQESQMRPVPILRPGSYHAQTLDPEAPSASALRAAIEAKESASEVFSAVPACLGELYAASPIHTMQAGERACLAILRTLPDAAFADLPFGSEGLWSKLMKACRSCSSVEEIVTAVKTKRYTLSRIRRMVLCAVLGLTAADLRKKPPYARILAFNDRGRSLLREMKSRFPLVNAGQQPDHTEYYTLETRAADLYSLFSVSVPRSAREEARLRVFVCP